MKKLHTVILVLFILSLSQAYAAQPLTPITINGVNVANIEAFTYGDLTTDNDTVYLWLTSTETDTGYAVGMDFPPEEMQTMKPVLQSRVYVLFFDSEDNILYMVKIPQQVK